jgi:hypothetical protein
MVAELVKPTDRVKVTAAAIADKRGSRAIQRGMRAVEYGQPEEERMNDTEIHPDVMESGASYVSTRSRDEWKIEASGEGLPLNGSLLETLAARGQAMSG